MATYRFTDLMDLNHALEDFVDDARADLLEVISELEDRIEELEEEILELKEELGDE